jgi:KUP system potassium uptake protein
MVFWTWARGLEDYFDGANRRNLRHFISKEITERFTPGTRQRMSISGPSSPTSAIVEIGGTQFQRMEKDNGEESDIIEDLHLYLDTGDAKVELPRMSTMAIFHKLSNGKGVPHTFYGFLKQWPALPRVVVSAFFSTRRV